ncbi:MAG: c-type cytochrome biogenesis protein CcmI [Hyphomicrobiales bacterium]|nr:c-type cytochrome biogenesis protein CcmI [Hyphomicrobiales bacterium]
MALHLIFVAMLVAAILAVLLPLARGAARASSAGASALDLHRLRLAEIARDQDRGLLDETSAEAARNEAARLLLRSVEARQPGHHGRSEARGEPARATPWRRRIVALVALLGIPALVLPLYAMMGSPGVPASPFGAAPEATAQTDLARMIGRIEAHLVEHPDEGKGFEVLAPVYLRLGRFADAVRARSEALRLLGETPDRLADLAEARMAMADGVVTHEAGAALDRALALDPKHPQARFLAAIGLEQDGRRDDAASALRAMLADAPAEAPWRQAVEAHLAALARPPDDKAAAIAGLAPSAQGDAIRSMVAGLAARLQRQGGSAEEWARLVRSLTVLGETEEARAALAQARASLPDEASRARLLEVAQATGLEAVGAMPQAASAPAAAKAPQP